MAKVKDDLLIISTSDEDADWLRYADDGEHKEADLLAHDEAKNLHEDE